MPSRTTQLPSGPTGQPTGRYSGIGGSSSEPGDRWIFDPCELGEACAAVLRRGDAIMLSTTQDGGALRVMVFEGETRHKFYASGAADVTELLHGLAQD